MCYSVVGIEIKAQIGSKQLGLEGGTMLNPPHGAQPWGWKELGVSARFSPLLLWMGWVGMALPAAE